MNVYRESPFSLGCWAKLIFTIGLYVFWWHAKKLIIDDKRVTYSGGVFGKFERSIPLDRVQDVSVMRPLFGRLFGYGTVRIESAGSSATEIVFRDVSNPSGIKRELVGE
jgi:uncharacterized membrane protein YdbT with pleckstrin-like domain